MLPSLDEFLSWSDAQVAAQLAQRGSQTGVVFLDGSRRWFMLENDRRLTPGWAEQYIGQSLRRHIETFERCFRHGLTTVVTPTVYQQLLLRDSHYDQVIQSVGLLLTHPDFLSFYEEQQVQVHFFGDYRQTLPGTRLEKLLPLIDSVTRQTSQHSRFRLFYGFFSRPAGESAQEIARLSVEHFQRTGEIPNQKQLIQLFYGAAIDPAAVAISFDPTPLEYPLLGGREHLYFSVRPTMYLDDAQLRRILYDHLYLRGHKEADYSQVDDRDFESLRQFYAANVGRALGCGSLLGDIWIPEQVQA